MRIGVNVVQFMPGGTGMTTYSSLLLQYLAQYAPQHEYTVVCNPTSAHIWRARLPAAFKCVTMGHPALQPRSSGKLLRRLSYDAGITTVPGDIRRLGELDLDILHFTGDRLSPWRSPFPTVLSFFSGNHWAIPWHRYWNNAFQQWVSRQNARYSLHVADSIVVPSAYLKQLLVEQLEIDPAKVFVVDLVGWTRGIADLASPAKVAAMRQEFKLPDRYLMFASTGHVYKNHDRLFAAYKTLAARGLDIPIVLTGRLHERVERLIASMNLKDVVRNVGYVSREQLANLYAGALAYVHPSLYEAGGSFSMYEAAACSCPVLCSRVGSMVEFMGNVAETFDPYDASDIARALQRVVSDDRRRETLRTGALAWLDRYSAQESIEDLGRAYAHAGRHVRQGNPGSHAMSRTV